MLENFLKKLKIDKNTRNITTTGDWIGSTNSVVINGTSIPNYYDDSMFNNISTVYICAKILANTLSRLPINVYKSENRFKSIDIEDPRHFLLHHQPNDILDSFHFWNYLELQRCLTGNSFAYIHRQFGGMPTSLEIIPNSWVTGYKKIYNNVFYNINYNYTREITVEAKDLLHFRDITKDTIWGISPVQILKMNASVSYKALSTVNNVYDNDARSTKILKPSVINKSIGDKAKYEELIKKVTETVSGYDKAGGWITLPSNMDLQEVQMNVNDALFLATVKFSAGQIASFYGIPPNLVGLFEQSKFNNVEQMQLNFTSETFAAIAKMYRRELEKKLLYKDEILGGKSIEFNLRAMVETDHKTRTDILLNEVKGGVRTINEYRREEDLPSVEGGDVLLTFNQNTPINQIKELALDVEKLKAYIKNNNFKSNE
ncbi:MAG: phage portal protein [Bacteroidales bacterium]|nr:phage portal protein [Bacteroidales bacterium]